MVRVLVVDDSVLIRKRLEDMLCATSGVDVVGETGNPYEVLDAMSRLKPDVVILDIHLPGRSGIDLLQDVKEVKPDCVVVMLTNYPYPEYRQKCMRSGADYFFHKSTQFEEAIEIVARMAIEAFPASSNQGKDHTPGRAHTEPDSHGCATGTTDRIHTPEEPKDRD